MTSNEARGTGSPGQSHGVQRLTTLQVNSAAATGFNTPPPAGSPASSRGSWVVDPEDGGWDGVGVSPPHSPAPVPRQQHRLSPAASPLRSWAQVPQSPPSAQFPTSPPRSPGSVRSSSGGSTAGEGLVGLARDEISDEMDVCEAPVACPSVPSPSRAPSLSEQKEEEETVVVGCTEIEDVDMVDVTFDDGVVEFPMVVSAGRTPAEAAEAIAEAAEELGAVTEAVLMHNAPSCVTAEASPLPARSDAVDVVVVPPAGTPPRLASPPRARVPPVATNARASPRADPLSGSSVRTTAWFPADPVDPIVDATVEAVGMGGVDVNDKYDSKYSDRLWRWTGLITAAKMGVIPIIVLGTVAALSTQNSGSGDRGGRTSGAATGGGGGGGAGGGGGGTRCSSRRPRPRGGGGGIGCLPAAHDDRRVYGCVPMPFCIAPSIVCA